MATKKKTPKKKAAEPAAPVEDHRLAAAPTPVPPSLNDSRADDDAVLGHFVDVVSGPEKGAYGVFIEAQGDDAVVRTRDDDSRRFTTPIKNLVPAESGRR